jgi:PAS domain S-box-containing protein
MNYLKDEFYELLKSDYDLFNIIQKTSPDGLWYLNTENTEDNWINARFWKTLGYTTKEISQFKSWKEVVHPEDIKSLLNTLSPKNNLEKPKEGLDIRYFHKNGSTVKLYSNNTAISDKQGKNTRMLFYHYRINDLNQQLDIFKENEAKYKTLLQNISDSVYIIDKKWNYILVNDTASDHTGIPKEQLLHSNVKDVFPGIEHSKFFELFQKVMTGRKPEMTELEYTLRDGRTNWYEVRVYPISEGILCISKDITGQKTAEDALKENKERFELMLNSTTDIFVELTASGHQKYISPVVERYTGYTPDELKRPFTEVIHPDDVERIKAHWQEVLDQPERIHRDEYRHIHKTKGYVWMEATLQSYLDHPNIQSIICSVRDISDRKKAEQAIKESEEQYKALSQAASDMLALNKLEDIYEYITQTLSNQFPNAVNLFVTADEQQYSTKVVSVKGLNKNLITGVLNVSPFNLIGRNFNLLPGHYKKYKTGKLYEFKGGLATFAASEFPTYAANSIEKLLGINKIYAIGINRDNKLYAVLHFFTRKKTELTNHAYIESFIKQAGIIIERKIMEQKLKDREKQLSEANATKDKFFSIIAHDLRNPFNLLMGYSEINLQNLKAKKYEKMEEAGKIIKESAEQGYILLNNLLEWSQSQQGRLRFNPGNISFKEHVEKITSLLSNAAKEKHITINYNFKNDLKIYADKNMLETIIRNLISNAIKFTNHGGSITISAKEKKHNVVVKISDSGIGIDPGNIPKLFKTEENFTNYGTSGEKGSGLGLILCREFVEKHNGKIDVESEPGEGTTFRFTLPAK